MIYLTFQSFLQDSNDFFTVSDFDSRPSTIFSHYPNFFTVSNFSTIPDFFPALAFFHGEFQGTIVAAMTYSCHKEESVWDRPEAFIPDRFLDETGKFSPKLDKSIPFGAGKRLCAGETFARNTLFLVTAALIQQFTFELPKNCKMPNLNDSHTGILRSPTDYRMKFVPR